MPVNHLVVLHVLGFVLERAATNVRLRVVVAVQTHVRGHAIINVIQHAAVVVPDVARHARENVVVNVKLNVHHVRERVQGIAIAVQVIALVHVLVNVIIVVPELVLRHVPLDAVTVVQLTVFLDVLQVAKMVA